LLAGAARERYFRTFYLGGCGPVRIGTTLGSEVCSWA
jgi:hypothetical protein